MSRLIRPPPRRESEPVTVVDVTDAPEPGGSEPVPLRRVELGSQCPGRISHQSVTRKGCPSLIPREDTKKIYPRTQSP